LVQQLDQSGMIFHDLIASLMSKFLIIRLMNKHSTICASSPLNFVICVLWWRIGYLFSMCYVIVIMKGRMCKSVNKTICFPRCIVSGYLIDWVKFCTRIDRGKAHWNENQRQAFPDMVIFRTHSGTMSDFHCIKKGLPRTLPYPRQCTSKVYSVCTRFWFLIAVTKQHPF